jgi:hypothetical protein
MAKKMVDSDDNNSFYIEPELQEATHDGDFVPFKKLFTAVLERAVLDLKDAGEIRQDAIEWISQEKTEDPEIFTFQLLCEVLELNFEQMQRGLLSRVALVDLSTQDPQE